MGNTPLHQASFFGRIDCAALLIETGADVNAKNNIGLVPLTKKANEGDFLSALLYLPLVPGLIVPS